MRLPNHSEPNDRHRDEPIEVNHFNMLVPLEGYSWSGDVTPSRLFGKQNSEKLGPEPYMVMKAPAHWGAAAIPCQSYFPLLAMPQLFQLFRNLNLDRDSILAFANRYGWLGNTGKVDQGKHLWIEAMGLSQWHEEIQAMIVAHHLWDCVQRDDRHTLRDYFAWDRATFNVRLSMAIQEREILPKSHSAMTAEDPSSFTLTPPFLTFDKWLIDATNVGSLQAIGWNRDDLLGPARLAVMNIVNPRLGAYCHPHLYLDKRGLPVGHLTPVNLLGCLWLQFYLTMIGQLKLRRCTVCKQEMDVSDSRSTRKTHDRCAKNARQQRWRSKKRLADQNGE
jgi:hypothetical protein